MCPGRQQTPISVAQVSFITHDKTHSAHNFLVYQKKKYFRCQILTSCAQLIKLAVWQKIVFAYSCTCAIIISLDFTRLASCRTSAPFTDGNLRQTRCKAFFETSFPSKHKLGLLGLYVQNEEHTFRLPACSTLHTLHHTWHIHLLGANDLNTRD